MALSLLSPPKPASLPDHPVVAALYLKLARKWTQLRAAPESPAHIEKARAALGDETAMLDEREWAERYLCGMTGLEFTAFQRDRRWQS